MESLAEKQSWGELTYEQVYEDATAYHHTIDASTEEADFISRIVELLSRRGFLAFF